MILLDTHVLVWTVTEPKRLSRPAMRAIERAKRTSGIAIASITLWELSNLFAKRRIVGSGTVTQSVHEYLEASGAHVFEITPEIAATASQLPSDVPGDPGDRLIVATALVHAIPLVTKDTRIHASKGCKAVW